MLRYVATSIFLGFVSFAASAQNGGFYADGIRKASLQAAFNDVKPGGIVRIEPGIYNQGGTLKKGKDGVLISGSPGVVFDGAVVGGKATFVIQSDNITIESVECKNVKVRSRNGACVRHESGNLTLRDVNFSHNENGILTWDRSNKILVEDSVFHGNGAGGRAHALYISGAKQLIVRRSRITGSKGDGHGIKSRAEHTLVEDSVVASLDGNDSYLIDIPNGGNAVIRNCLLVEGANTANWFLFTFGVEKQPYSLNSLKMEKNVIVSDREGGSQLINIHDSMPAPSLRGNVVVGSITYDWPDNNFFFDSRSDLNWPAAPALPDIDLGAK